MTLLPRARPILAIILGAIAGVLSAGVILLWWRSPIPTFLIFTAILHGMLLGACLMWVVSRLDVHCPVRRTAVGVVAGVVSIATLTFGHYVSDAYAHQRQMQAAAETLMPTIVPSPDGDVLLNYDRDVLEPVIGRGGVVGHVRLITRDHRWLRWTRGAEALLVVGIATALCVTFRIPGAAPVAKLPAPRPGA